MFLRNKNYFIKLSLAYRIRINSYYGSCLQMDIHILFIVDHIFWPILDCISCFNINFIFTIKLNIIGYFWFRFIFALTMNFNLISNGYYSIIFVFSINFNFVYICCVRGYFIFNIINFYYFRIYLCFTVK